MNGESLSCVNGLRALVIKLQIGDTRSVYLFVCVVNYGVANFHYSAEITTTTIDTLICALCST